MSTKNISISEEAYKLLAMRKMENESFSKLIVREMGRKGDIEKLKGFFGVLSKETGDALEKSMKEGRAMNREMHKKRIERFQKEFEA